MHKSPSPCSYEYQEQLGQNCRGHRALSTSITHFQKNCRVTHNMHTKIFREDRLHSSNTLAVRNSSQLRIKMHFQRSQIRMKQYSVKYGAFSCSKLTNKRTIQHETCVLPDFSHQLISYPITNRIRFYLIFLYQLLHVYQIIYSIFTLLRHSTECTKLSCCTAMTLPIPRRLVRVSIRQTIEKRSITREYDSGSISAL